ncbi:MAG: acylneuraminate cytidylyltransferase family protein [bacterium]|nr:acylneuraminate cytidylyltransferase family protein [bacterium]
MKKHSVLVVIPAKARSTRIPGKNLKDLCGKPMMAYIIETAKSARGVDRVVVTTESEEIKRVAEQYGAEVPFIRPQELTADTATSQEVLVHALDALKAQEGYEPDYVLLLYPTSPLLSRERIEQAIALAIEKDADSVVSGHHDKGHYWTEDSDAWKRLYPIELVNSQYQKPLFKENGAMYLTRSSVLRKQLLADRTQVLIMDPDENVDVDYPEDFARVEKILLGKGKA